MPDRTTIGPTGTVVVVLHSDISGDAGKDEQDVLVQVEVVSQALAELRCEVHRLAFSMDLAEVAARLREVRPALVFNLVETVAGTGRLIHVAPALLDHLGIPYTGAPTDATFLSSNKLLAKRLLTASAVPTPAWFDLADLRRNAVVAHGDYVVKSLWEHASVGLDEDSVVFAKGPADLIREMASRSAVLGGSCFAEAFVDGREFNLSLLADGNGGCRVLPPAEIRFDGFPAGKRQVVGYRAKWEAESFEYRHTTRGFSFGQEDGTLLRRLEEIAGKCWDIFSLRGYARVDFRVDRSGAPWVLEVNTNPCLSPDAGFAAAAAQAGLSFQQVVASIVADCHTASCRSLA